MMEKEALTHNIKDDLDARNRNWGKVDDLSMQVNTNTSELANKVDKVEGKDLSTNDYTDEEKQKLANIQAGANKTVISNNLNETTLGRALDATQGKILKDEINLVSDEVTSLGNSFDSHKEDFDSFKEDYANYQNDNNLKIAKVEKELNNYKSTMANVNVNQEAKQTASGYGIVSLPKNAANGQVSVSVKGNTETDEEDNTKSTQSASRLKSVGKNLWNLDSEWKIKEVIDGLVCNKVNGYVNAITLLPFANSKIPIKTNGYKQNTRYTVQAKVKGSTLSLRIYYTDGTDETVSWGSTDFATKVATTSIGKTVKAVSFSTESDLSFAYIAEGTFQLEENIQATQYEPYTESNMYIPNVGELRSLPNGVRDEIRVSGGKAELIKRVSDDVVSTRITATITSGLNNNYYRIFYFYSNPIRTLHVASRLRDISTNTLVQQTSYADRDLIENRGKYYATDAGEIYLITDKTTTPTVNHALTYQLAEPEIIPIQVSGSLISHPNGTVYVEPVVADAGMYTDKLNVLDSKLPIAYIEKLSKVDFNTGVETELDSSKCVIAENKLSFTHPDLVTNDIVFFTYFYDRENTLGETTIEYYDSRYVLKDDVTGKFYKVVPKVSNGELINDLVEV